MNRLIICLLLSGIAGCGDREQTADQQSRQNEKPEAPARRPGASTIADEILATQSEPAIAESGTLNWAFSGDSQYTTPVIGDSSPAVGADGTVYVGSRNKKVVALDGKTGAQKWEFQTDGEFIFAAVRSSPAVGLDGTVYIGSMCGTVYAIASESNGLADSSWPMRGQNLQHTGRAAR